MIRSLSLFVTERCNLGCRYCYARGGMEGRDIAPEVARRAIDLALAAGRPGEPLGVSFWGGEPLMVLPLLRELAAYAREGARRVGRPLRILFPTNATLINDEAISFIDAFGVQLSLSLDGDEQGQADRPTASGASSFPLVLRALTLLSRRAGEPMPPVRLTVTPGSAGRLDQNVTWLLGRGIRQVFFAPVVEAGWDDGALGRLAAAQVRLADRWLGGLGGGPGEVFFPSWDRQLMARSAARRGARPTRPILACGAGETTVAVDLHGDVFPCHRLVFYDKERRATAMGNVMREGLPGAGSDRGFELDWRRLGPTGQTCAACEAVAACRQICPAVSYALTGDTHRVHPDQCRLSRVERDVADHIERVGAHSEALRRHVDVTLPRLHGGPEGDPELRRVLRALHHADPDRLAERAEAVLRGLPRKMG